MLSLLCYVSYHRTTKLSTSYSWLGKREQHFAVDNLVLHRFSAVGIKVITIEILLKRYLHYRKIYASLQLNVYVFHIVYGECMCIGICLCCFMVVNILYCV